MQHIERPSSVPSVLVSPRVRQARQIMREFWLLEPQRRAQTSVPPPGLGPDDSETVDALAAITGGRCAYCEAEGKLFVHRFRPSGNALPLTDVGNGHLYYLWLADAWQNLLPVCETCIPQEPQFPVRGARAALPPQDQVDLYVRNDDGRWPAFPPRESPILLDPTTETAFERHLLPKLDGELIGESQAGETTIIVHDLNRSDRLHQRYQAYQARTGHLAHLLQYGSAPPRDDDWAALFDFGAMPFGGTWYLLLRRLARWLNGATGRRWRTTRPYIRAYFERLANQPDAKAEFQDAMSALAMEDDGLRGGRWGLGRIFSLRTPLASVEISNFKSIEHLNLAFQSPQRLLDDPSMPSAPSLVILGENATGKSSILEAIALALAPPQARSRLGLRWSRLVLDPTQLGMEKAGPPRRASIDISLANGQHVSLAIERGSPQVQGDFGNGQVPVFAYGAFRRYLSGTRKSAAHEHIRNLFDGSTLPNPEPWLKRLPDDAFNLVIRTLRDLLSIEGEFDVIQREGGQLRMVTSLTEPSGTIRYSRTPLQAVSSGFRSMLAMVCDIMKGLLDPSVYESFESFQTAQGVVLIDEIEAHLHPRWKVQVMTSLRRALPGMTFIVTTHDPLCLRGMGDDEVAVLQRIAASDTTQPSQLPILVECMADLPPVSALRVEQLLTSDFFQMLSSDDAASDRRLARIGDLIAAQARGTLLAEDELVLRAFEADIAAALPVGSSEVHRLVQEAVAEYLAKRRAASSAALQAMRQEAKDEILRALELL